jgi:hypothetical protein
MEILVQGLRPEFDGLGFWDGKTAVDAFGARRPMTGEMREEMVR